MVISMEYFLFYFWGLDEKAYLVLKMVLVTSTRTSRIRFFFLFFFPISHLSFHCYSFEKKCSFSMKMYAFNKISKT